MTRSKPTVAARWERRGGVGVDAWVFSCSGLPVRGLNGSKGLLRMHWAARRSYQNAIAAVLRSGAPDRIQGRVVVLYARGYRTQPMDEDNLAASAKPILDGLRAVGVVDDDSPEHVTLRCVQRRTTELGCDWQIAVAPFVVGAMTPFTCGSVPAGRARSRSVRSGRSAPPGPASAF